MKKVIKLERILHWCEYNTWSYRGCKVFCSNFRDYFKVRSSVDTIKLIITDVKPTDDDNYYKVTTSGHGLMLDTCDQRGEYVSTLYALDSMLRRISIVPHKAYYVWVEEV